jgi:hypothetical protein
MKKLITNIAINIMRAPSDKKENFKQMKFKSLSYIFFIALLTYSCSESFDPLGEFREDYALTCILKSDSSFQVATLSHSYRGNSYDPYSNTEDPSIIGADIRVWLGDSVYIFRDSSVVRTEPSRYGTHFHFYYNNNFIISPDENIEIEALLQNGRRLKASSRAPGTILFRSDSDILIPAVGSNLVRFLWEQQAEGMFFAPQLMIRYKQNENGNVVEKLKVIPIEYTQENGEQLPVYPKPSNKINVNYQLDAISKALEEISESDPDKGNFSVYKKPIFTLFAFDMNLSRYVSSTNQAFDDLTVTVNEADFTNVEGGLGIFGAYVNKVYDNIQFQENYIESFGYKFISTN